MFLKVPFNLTAIQKTFFKTLSSYVKFDHYVEIRLSRLSLYYRLITSFTKIIVALVSSYFDCCKIK